MDISIMLNNPITYLILIILTVAAIGYAWGYIRRRRRQNPNHGQTALFVVIGSGAVGIVYTIGLSASYGISDAIAPAIFLFLCYIAAGLPMIIEYIDDHTDRTSESVIDKVTRILEE